MTDRKTTVYKLIEEHYRKNANTLVKKMSRSIGNLARAEDVVQEAYARCLKFWKVFPEDGNMGPWFGTILQNCMRDNYKEERMQGMSDSIEGMELPTQPSAIPAIHYKEVVALIESKEPKIAKILSLSLLHQYRPKEVAQVVKESPNYIGQVVWKFREELKNDSNWRL